MCNAPTNTPHTQHTKTTHHKPQNPKQGGGWLSPDTADAFGKYADVMFDALGDKVKIWFTLNEPWTTSIAG